MKIYINKELFQWEKNREVFLELSASDPKISYVQFYNKKSKTGPEIAVVNNTAQIPNFLLEQDLPITAAACIGELGKTLVVARREFKVLKRVKPVEYENGNTPGYPDENEEIIYDGGEEN